MAGRDILLEFRKVTGLPESQIREALEKTTLAADDVLEVYKALGRFPTAEDTIAIQSFGLHYWLSHSIQDWGGINLPQGYMCRSAVVGIERRRLTFADLERVRVGLLLRSLQTGPLIKKIILSVDDYGILKELLPTGDKIAYADIPLEFDFDLQRGEVKVVYY